MGLEYFLYSGLNEDVPYTFRYLSTWSPVGGTIWALLPNLTLLEKIFHLGQAFSIYGFTPLLNLHFLLKLSMCVLSILHLLACLLLTCASPSWWTSFLWDCKPTQTLSSISFLWPRSQEQKNNLYIACSCDIFKFIAPFYFSKYCHLAEVP